MTIRDRSFGWRSVLAIVLVAVAAAVIITIVAGHALVNDAAARAESDSATVRISALRSASGAVRVALQQQDASGAWGEREHPERNTVRATAQAGVWLSSSALSVAVALPPVSDGPLFCIVAHGGRHDRFWRNVRGYSRLAAREAGLNVRFAQSLDGAEQAAAIDQCSADGAVVIASTLADPSAVRESLIAAKTAGARIITFNSGTDLAVTVGSELHIALDETAAGRLAGEEFNARGTEGAIGCVIHEADNIGLEQRCDALAAAYLGGDTVRIRVPEGGDAEQVRQAMTERLLDPEEPSLSALLTLNGGTMGSVLKAVIATAEQFDHHIQVASISPSLTLAEITREQRERHVAFFSSHAGEVQGYLVTAALHMVHQFGPTASFIRSPTILTATPFIFDDSTALTDPAELAETLRRARAILALGDEYDSEESAE